MKHAGFIAVIVASAGLVSAGAVLAQTHGGMKSGGFGHKISFEQLDTDGDGEITQAEMEARRAAHFAKADTDGDGKLNLAELQVQARKKAENRAAMMLEKHDANSDGALSQEELVKPRRMGHMFERMDADSSGALSKDEFEQARSMMRQHGMGKHRHGQEAGETLEQN